MEGSRNRTIRRCGAIASFALSAAVATAWAQSEPVAPAGMPLGDMAHGLPAELSYRLRDGFSWSNAYATDDRNVYYFMNWEEFVPHRTVWRAGPVSELARTPNDDLGGVRAESFLGELSLDEALGDPRSRIQGFVVVHGGKIVFERYPGMRDQDHHMWFSVSKTITSLLLGMLEAEGRIDVERPIEEYLPEAAGTHWAGVRIIDIADMASGMDILEDEASRNDAANSVSQWFQIEIGDTTGLGTLTSDQILLAVGKRGEPGQVFEYSSLNTRILGLLVEEVSGRRMPDLISERIWSKMGAEGDALVAVNLQGRAGLYGLYSSRLRDMARYGMLYTPSWNTVAAEPVVPEGLLDKIRNGCRPAIYRRMVALREAAPDPDGPRCNSRQWDAVFADGDIYKAGARGQGLYVSPSRDVVVAWFSTSFEGEWRNYGRAVSKHLRR